VDRCAIVVRRRLRQQQATGYDAVGVGHQANGESFYVWYRSNFDLPTLVPGYGRLNCSLKITVSVIQGRLHSGIDDVRNLCAAVKTIAENAGHVYAQTSLVSNHG
jgi:hypothetical protein